MKYIIEIEHEILSGYIVWESDEEENLVAVDSGSLLVFDSVETVEEVYQDEELTLEDFKINNCLIELSTSLHSVNLSNRDHFVIVHNILDDIAINIKSSFIFQGQDDLLDLFHDYEQFSVDTKRMQLLFNLVESVNQFILGLSKSFILSR